MDWTPLIITVAPNGARKTKADHPALPMTPDEIAKDAKACLAAGAAMMHLHVRDGNGEHSLDISHYQQAMDAVHTAVGNDLVLQITTESVGRYTPDEQIALVKNLKPEAASVGLKELTLDGDDKATAFYTWASNEGIALQHILYDIEDIAHLANIVNQGAIPSVNLHVLYVLGRYGGEPSQPADLLPFLDAAEVHKLQPTTWSVCAFGAGEGAVALTALSLGGHVRVGFENNLYLNSGQQSPHNAALVKQVADGAELIARPLCHAQDVRALMGAGGEGGRKSRIISKSEEKVRHHTATQPRDVSTYLSNP
ncbi:MAG: 3-keto-5-aminohexanoate cleavage protein [Magnetovibrio sp.]|nr:3-keto-5-aminohexanoate cleavage protein [Magnetovibrio sp.]